MEPLQPARIFCPYCGEANTLLVDISTPAQQYTEDCAVCCRAIEIEAVIDEAGEPTVSARREDE